MNNSLVDVVGVFVLAVLLFGAVTLASALPCMLLWNMLMPDIFGLPTLSFWQAFGLNILSALLFKSSYNVRSSK